MTRHGIRSYLMAGFWILAGVGAPLLLAGDLTPPVGPVAATMKTLQQVEPRVDVQTLGGTLNATYYINAAGSYYLTDNIVGEAGKHGIEIDADNVTLDLRGFALIGDGSLTSGVFVVGGIITRGVGPAEKHSIAVYNGSVQNWGNPGIDMSNAVNSRVEKVRAYQCGGGVSLGSNSSIIDSHAESNFGAGIRTGDTCTVRGCTARDNQNGGIRAGNSASIEGCVASSNTYGGFFAERGSALHTCAARTNFGAPAINSRRGGGG